jgi:large subunit ribosomal protein L14e
VAATDRIGYFGKFAETMGFTEFVQVGRVIVIIYGPLYGKLAVILDILDQNRILIEGPRSVTGVDRQVIQLKRVKLTPIVINIRRQSRTKNLLKAVQENDIVAKFAKTTFAQKLARQDKRANINDFDRHKLMVVKKKRAQAYHKAFIALGGKELRSYVRHN